MQSDPPECTLNQNHIESSPHSPLVVTEGWDSEDSEEESDDDPIPPEPGALWFSMGYGSGCARSPQEQTRLERAWNFSTAWSEWNESPDFDRGTRGPYAVAISQQPRYYLPSHRNLSLPLPPELQIYMAVFLDPWSFLQVRSADRTWRRLLTLGQLARLILDDCLSGVFHTQVEAQLELLLGTGEEGGFLQRHIPTGLRDLVGHVVTLLGRSVRLAHDAWNAAVGRDCDECTRYGDHGRAWFGRSGPLDLYTRQVALLRRFESGTDSSRLPHVTSREIVPEVVDSFDLIVPVEGLTASLEDYMTWNSAFETPPVACVRRTRCASLSAGEEEALLLAGGCCPKFVLSARFSTARLR